MRVTYSTLMACARGKASPNWFTKLKLFSDAGGYCQNPACLEPLFLDLDDEQIHIAEVAHVFSAADAGPRAEPVLSAAQRGAYENLILLCSRCHTIIDKAEDKFPDDLVMRWKLAHKAKIAETFGTVRQPDRASARKALEPLFAENAEIFNTYGPHVEANQNFESETAVQWRRKIPSKIVPNNRKALQILDANKEYLTAEEVKTVAQFRQHVDDFEAKLIDRSLPSGLRFPVGAADIFL